MNALKQRLTILSDKRVILFAAHNEAAATITLINSTLADSAIKKFRPCLDVLKQNLLEVHELAADDSVIRNDMLHYAIDTFL